MCVGFESLVRWTRDGKAVSPVTFIPIAEELGLIEPLGTWVLQQACSTFADWQRRFPAAVSIRTVNVSSRQLMHPRPPRDFLWIIQAVITPIETGDLLLASRSALMDAHEPRSCSRGVSSCENYLDDFGSVTRRESPAQASIRLAQTIARSWRFVTPRPPLHRPRAFSRWPNAPHARVAEESSRTACLRAGAPRVHARPGLLFPVAVARLSRSSLSPTLRSAAESPAIGLACYRDEPDATTRQRPSSGRWISPYDPSPPSKLRRRLLRTRSLTSAHLTTTTCFDAVDSSCRHLRLGSHRDSLRGVKRTVPPYGFHGPPVPPRLLQIHSRSISRQHLIIDSPARAVAEGLRCTPTSSMRALGALYVAAGHLVTRRAGSGQRAAVRDMLRRSSYNRRIRRDRGRVFLEMRKRRLHGDSRRSAVPVGPDPPLRQERDQGASSALYARVRQRRECEEHDQSACETSPPQRRW